MPDKKLPKFKNEAEEADWWVRNEDFIAERFELAQKAGRLGTGTVAKLARERTAQAGASPTITIRLPETDLTRARAFAAQRGLRYQTYLKMLLHQALDTEERKRRVATRKSIH
jgi:predicted DNA binding CopG/RHH family protein